MTKSWVMVLLDYFRDADLQFPGLHDKDLYDMLPTPIGEKKLNSKQSFKVNSNLNLKIAVLSLLHLGCSMEAKRNYAREKERRLLRHLWPQEPKKRPISQLNALDCITVDAKPLNSFFAEMEGAGGEGGEDKANYDTEAPVLHVLVVGFHHKKGCQVRAVWQPPVILNLYFRLNSHTRH